MKFNRQTLIRLAVLSLVASVPVFAQGPFAAPLQNLQQFALYFAKIASVIAMIVGFGTMAFGDGHRAGGFITLLFGVGGMAMAQQIVNWLFP
jgi:hypothetical protein